MNVLFAGTSSQKTFIRDLWFSGDVTETPLGSCFSWSLNRIAERSDCQLVSAIQSVDALHLLPTSGYVLPLWVTSAADTSVSPYKIPGKSLKGDLARIRRNNLTCELSKSVNDFDFFWDHMYVPYMESQHAGQAIVVSREQFREQLLEGHLFLTFSLADGKRVAGGTVSTDGPIPNSHHLGLLHGDQSLKPLGALAAVYVFELEWAWRSGYKQLVLGATRPLLRDGVLQYKKKFNIELRNSDFRKVIYVNPVRSTAAVVSALVSNPMICIDKQNLIATVFESDEIGHPAPSDLWLHRSQMISGLDDVKHVSLSTV